MPQKETDKICHPYEAFDKTNIQTLMKPKCRRRQPEARRKSTGEASFEAKQILWKMLFQMQKKTERFL